MTVQRSQTALYGELLTNEQCYSFQVNQLSLLTEQQQADLWEQLRQGDRSGKEQLLLSFLRYIKCVAATLYETYRWSSTHLEYLEIVQVGHLALLEHVETAIEKPKPTGCLLTCVKFDMRDYCHRFQRAISTPEHETPLPLDSLDRPISSQMDHSRTLADCIPAPGNLTPTMDVQFEGLYQSLALLNPTQREVIERHYGLHEHAPELLNAISRQKHQRESTIRHTKRRALRKLRALLQAPKSACEVYSLEQAYQRLGMSKEGFCTAVTRSGVSSVYRGYYRKADIERLASQRGTDLDTYTVQEVYAFFGLNRMNFGHFRQRYGLKQVAHNRYAKAEIDALIARLGVREEVYTRQEAREFLGVSNSRFSGLLATYGVKSVAINHYRKTDIAQIAQRRAQSIETIHREGAKQLEVSHV